MAAAHPYSCNVRCTESVAAFIVNSGDCKALNLPLILNHSVFFSSRRCSIYSARAHGCSFTVSIADARLRCRAKTFCHDAADACVKKTGARLGDRRTYLCSSQRFDCFPRGLSTGLGTAVPSSISLRHVPSVTKTLDDGQVRGKTINIARSWFCVAEMHRNWQIGP